MYEYLILTPNQAVQNMGLRVHGSQYHHPKPSQQDALNWYGKQGYRLMAAHSHSFPHGGSTTHWYLERWVEHDDQGESY